MNFKDRNNSGMNNNYNNQNRNRNNYTNHLSRQVQLRRQRRKRTSMFMKYGFRLLMFLIFFIAVSAIFLALFFISLTKITPPQDILYTVTNSQIKDSKPQNITLPYDSGFVNGQYYFPVNDIMEKMDFGLAGDGKEVSFFRDKSDEYVKFIVGENIAYINDEKYHLPGPCFAGENNDIYVPLNFLGNIFKNLQFSFKENGNGNGIAIDILNIEESCLRVHKAEKIEAALESEAPYFSGDPINFIADLSEYEIYFNPPRDTANDYIILINQTHKLEQDYLPPDLTDLADTRKDGQRSTQQMRLYPAMALEAFLIEARANGFNNISVTSAYRDYAYQSQLFNEEVARTGNEETAAISVAYPGQSEHQSGLCADMHSVNSADQNFGNMPDGKWLAENAHHFGFIVRYQQNKTEITGIKYEPWHFRYVGRYHATRIYELNLCLEEYWEHYLNN